MRKIRSFAKAHRGATAAIVAGALVLSGLGIWWFAPQTLFFDQRVDEAIPTVAAPSAEPPASPVEETASPPPAAEEASAVELARGDFRSLEHSSSGAAVILELEDGSRFLRLEDLKTSNGPDLIVILTDQPVSDDWNVWDDGEVLDLGPLTGNVGSSNYEIPADVDLSRYQTAVVWCRRFRVGFAVAPLEPPS